MGLPDVPRVFVKTPNHLPFTDRHDLAIGERRPSLASEGDAGGQHDTLGLRPDREAGDLDWHRSDLAGTAQQMQPGGSDGIVRGGLPLVTVEEDRIAVGIDEIRRPEAADFRGEVGNNPETLLNFGYLIHVGPQRGQAMQQGAEGVFGVGLTDRQVATEPQIGRPVDTVEVAVVRE